MEWGSGRMNAFYHGIAGSKRGFRKARVGLPYGRGSAGFVKVRRFRDVFQRRVDIGRNACRLESVGDSSYLRT